MSRKFSDPSIDGGAAQATDRIGAARAGASITLPLSAVVTLGGGTYQPLDSDLTAIALLATSSFGRALLEAADAAALRTAASLGTKAQFDTALTDGDFVYQGGALGTPSSGVATNLTGTASGLTAGNATLAATVTTNANLTGPITSTGNATAITSPMVINVIDGGIAANDDITIQGTSHATRTTSYVGLQPNGGVVAVGSTTAPTARLGQPLEVITSANYGGMVLSTWSATADHGPILDLNKSASNTVGTQTAVANTARLGTISARGSDGTAMQDGAAIVFRADGAVSSGRVPGLIEFYTSSTTTANVLRARLNAAGNFGFGGNSTPTAKMHPAAGTAAANTAPLKLNSGTLLTTAEAGAVEFLTDKFYGTITTGAARKTFAFLESPVFTGRVDVPLYTVATLPAVGAAGGEVFVTDAAVAACLAISNGTNWKRCDNMATTVV